MGSAVRYASALIVLAWLLTPVPAFSQASELAETKAEYLYRSLRYVTWPREAFRNRNEPIVIGVLGDAPFASFLRGRVGQREVVGRGVLVRTLRDDDALNGMHVLYVADSLRDRLRQVMLSVHGPVFIVTESKGALQQGSALNFIVSDKRVAFEVNPAAARERSIELSAQLLQPAVRVLDAPAPQ